VGETIRSAALVCQLIESPDKHVWDDRVQSPGSDDAGRRLRCQRSVDDYDLGWEKRVLNMTASLQRYRSRTLHQRKQKEDVLLLQSVCISVTDQ